MGKIRVKTLGDETLEKEQKNEAKKRKEAKKTIKAPGAKGGERVVSVGPSPEEIEKIVSEEAVAQPTSGEKQKEPKKNFEKKAFRSKKYQALSQSLDKTKTYALDEALRLLEKLQRGDFDESVELHVNTLTTGVSGNVTLPYGTGKKTKVAVADDKLIEEIEKGIINFDVLIAEPSNMPKLARVAKILGPRGLMPNPKNGTITEKPQDVAKKYEDGQVNFKTEAKAPIIHTTVGKISFGSDKLAKNIETFLSAVKKQNIKDVTLKSTMSPGVKIQI